MDRPPLDKPPFDTVRASFYLIAAILGVQCVVILLGVGACLWWGESVVAGKWSCENINGMVTQLLTNALAAALAFAGGFSKRDDK